MKTYQTIKQAGDAKVGDILVNFYPKSNEVWHRFKVLEVTENGIELHCPSGACIWVENEELANENDYFKRVN